MIEKEKWICDICQTEISKEDNVAYTDNGSQVIGNTCICEFCYLNLQKAW